LTVCYYLLLWLFQRKRQAAFKAAALEVIGPTKGLEITSIDKEVIFGTTSMPQNVDAQILNQEKELNISEQLDRATVFENTSVIENSELVSKTIPEASTDTEIQQEAISDLNTKEELDLIATELGYYEPSEKSPLSEENDLEEMMAVFNDFSGLYQQEVQEVIGNNTKHTL